MIPAGVRLPCSADPARWDLPAWVTSQEEAINARIDASEAQRVCRAECPARDGCLAQAKANPPRGQVMGGWIWSRQAQPIGVKDWHPVIRESPECGSVQGYKRHKNRGEDPCKACLQAYRVSNANRKRRARTHCTNGHEYTKQNTKIDTRGARRCRTCWLNGRVA